MSYCIALVHRYLIRILLYVVSDLNNKVISHKGIARRMKLLLLQLLWPTVIQMSSNDDQSYNVLMACARIHRNNLPDNSIVEFVYGLAVCYL